MVLEHFSHEHPLIFNEAEKHEDVGNERGDHSCNGCGQQISGAFYCCDGCKFFLHKLCAELPRQMEHPIHPHHPLTLYRKARWPVGFICKACRTDCNKFTYSCVECDFNMDIICASLMERKIEHKSHNHPLIFVRKPALFRCDACGTKHEEGVSYQCTINWCPYWIHRECASLPSTIKHIDHDHPLTLAYSPPFEYFKFLPGCEICDKGFDPMYWVYCCNKCRYFAHVNCATSKNEPFMSILLPRRKDDKATTSTVEDLDLSVIHLPVSDKSVILVNHFQKGMNLGDNERSEKELNHFSHDHPLILFDVEGKTKMDNDEKVLCDACIQPISAPFYKCTQCNFLLHKCCADLPTEVLHPCHPDHPLTLLAKSPGGPFGIFRCRGCEFYCNGFAFYCADCNYSLDVKCGSLLHAVKHEAHTEHLLFLRNKPYKHLRCHTCDFKLSLKAALYYPRTFRHRYDEHPFYLTYGPVKDHSTDDYCEICENEINPKRWFYHCGECDQFMHLRCTHRFHNNMNFGCTLNLESHPHSLTLAPVEWGDSSLCNHCGDRAYFPFAFKCLPCKFMLHTDCASSRSKEGS